MGGGRTGLFVGTKGADPQQLSIISEPIPARRRSSNCVIEQSTGIGGIELSVTKKSRILLLTPRDVLIKCMHWRIGAVSEGNLIRWIQDKLSNKRCRMMPSQLRLVLAEYVSKLEATLSVGKGYDTEMFIALIVQLEGTLETM